MNCPYCKKQINGFTGLQEAQKFQKHLNKCKAKPVASTRTEGRQVFNLNDALEIRAQSGQ